MSTPFSNGTKDYAFADAGVLTDSFELFGGIFVIMGSKYELVYSDVFFNMSLSDNSGTVCADVYFSVRSLCTYVI